MAAKKVTTRRAMSKAHKAALAEGRNEGRVVRRYLDALEANTPRRGRRRTPESIARRLAMIERTIADVDRLSKLKLAQERLDLQDELDAMTPEYDLGELVADFIEIAANYSDRQGISYAAWREAGVPAAVLREAGIGRAG